MKTRESFVILIAERNPHVRELLKREFAPEGYKIIFAKNGAEILEKIRFTKDIDLLVLDSAIVDLSESEFLSIMKKSPSPLPVIIHTYSKEDIDSKLLLRAASVVEKEGGSIECLKKEIFEIVRKNFSNS